MLVVADGAARPSRSEAEVAADGSFAIADITPGIASLLFSWGNALELPKGPGMHFAAGEANQDPRLPGLELACGWRRLVLCLSGLTGEALTSFECQLMMDGESQGRVLRTDPEGHLEEWVPPVVQRCTLRLEHPPPIAIDWSPERQDLRLAPGIRVTLPVEGELIPPAWTCRSISRATRARRSPRS